VVSFSFYGGFSSRSAQELIRDTRSVTGHPDVPRPRRRCHYRHARYWGPLSIRAVFSFIARGAHFQKEARVPVDMETNDISLCRRPACGPGGTPRLPDWRAEAVPASRGNSAVRSHLRLRTTPQAFTVPFRKDGLPVLEPQQPTWKTTSKAGPRCVVGRGSTKRGLNCRDWLVTGSWSGTGNPGPGWPTHGTHRRTTFSGGRGLILGLRLGLATKNGPTPGYGITLRDHFSFPRAWNIFEEKPRGASRNRLSPGWLPQAGARKDPIPIYRGCCGWASKRERLPLVGLKDRRHWHTLRQVRWGELPAQKRNGSYEGSRPKRGGGPRTEHADPAGPVPLDGARPTPKPRFRRGGGGVRSFISHTTGGCCTRPEGRLHPAAE